MKSPLDLSYPRGHRAPADYSADKLDRRTAATYAATFDNFLRRATVGWRTLIGSFRRDVSFCKWVVMEVLRAD